MNDYLIERKSFSQINISDPFFDSLKDDYAEFEEWFLKKAKSDKKAYLIESESGIEAFLYLKIETEELIDLNPVLPERKRLKVGTFKINPHGTRLGERFIKKIFDHIIKLEIDEVYVTIFPKHIALIDLFKKYGFKEVAEKSTHNGVEKVFLRSMSNISGNILLDYPLVNLNTPKYILAIYPKFHTQLFPDSILNNETFDILDDVSHTNSTHKIYICFMDISVLKKGDIILIYRTKDNKGPAEHRSVVTSICVVEELRSKLDFKSKEEFVDYCKKYSIFSPKDLAQWYDRKRVFVIKMTYNVALEKRVTRGNLITKIGLNRDIYWGFFKLSDEQFANILKLGGVDENFIIS